MRIVLAPLMAMLAAMAPATATLAADPAGSPVVRLDGDQLVAQASAPSATEPLTAAPVPNSSGISGYFANWFNRVEQAQASQPHWMTPLVTVTPRLEQEVRYDQYWEHLGNGAEVNSFGSGKGLELIPTTTNEVLLNPPAYLERSVKKPATGWGDVPFLTVKQRLLSANEQEGNYIVTAFLGFQAPTGSVAFTNHAWVITPTIAGGKGWGDFDIQATVGVPIPLAHEKIIGTSIVTNVAFQYHIAKYFWPEFEVNYTYWADGLRGGQNQVFLLPGIIIGRIPIYNRLKFVIGVGYQFAVSPHLKLEPALTPVYDHAWILSARLPF